MGQAMGGRTSATEAQNVFQAAMSGDKYILAKKHGHSRISKRMEKALKKQEFPRLWTSCVIIKEMEQRGGLA